MTNPSTPSYGNENNQPNNESGQGDQQYQPAGDQYHYTGATESQAGNGQNGGSRSPYGEQQNPYAQDNANSSAHYSQNGQFNPNQQYSQSNPYAQQGQYSSYGSYGQPSWQSNPYGSRMSSKSKIVAGLLAIFFGTFGIHNFYLGKTGRAVTQLLLTVLTFGIGAIAVQIWAVVEGIYILASHPGSLWHQDALGFELQD